MLLPLPYAFRTISRDFRWWFFVIFTSYGGFTGESAMVGACSPSKSICCILTPKGDGFRRWGLLEGIRQSLHVWEWCLTKETPEGSLAPSTMGVEVCNLVEGPPPTTLAPQSWTSSLHNCEQWISVVQKLPSLWSLVRAARNDSDRLYAIPKCFLNTVVFVCWSCVWESCWTTPSVHPFIYSSV